MEDQKSIMQQVQEIGVESLRTTLRGIVGKGPLVGFMLLSLVAVVWYFEREKKEWRQDFAEQRVRMEVLEKGFFECNLARMEQAVKIKNLEDQIMQFLSTSSKIRKK